jgi:hypothetical protein
LLTDRHRNSLQPPAALPAHKNAARKHPGRHLRHGAGYALSARPATQFHQAKLICTFIMVERSPAISKASTDFSMG